MTLSSTPQTPETLLQKERRICREQLRRLANCFINRTFELTVKGSQRRNQLLIALFIMFGIFFTFMAHPLVDWGNELSHLFQALFSLNFMTTAPLATTQFFTFALGAIIDPDTLRYLPVLILPFLIALQSAAIYLADIFELKKVEIAREFILQVALQGSNESIRIGNGEVSEKDKNSPIYQIGGPGQVLVELDTAVLFEKPNGQPHVIGPTTKGKAKLEGFERFRQAIDLRNQYTDPLVVKSRSFEGIPVSAVDVRLVFSVWREGKQPSVENPHPFSEKAIESLVYRQASRVILDRPNPSEPPSSWTGTIQGLIRSELGGFMSRHRLTEYLASIGPPEIQQARQREQEITRIGNAVVVNNTLVPRAIPSVPNFQARNIVSSLFSQFAEGFTQNASNRGVELDWIGIGTWKTPNEIIPEQHLDAWKLSLENLKLSRQENIDAHRENIGTQELLQMIRETPLMTYQECLSAGLDDQKVVKELLLAYRSQLKLAWDIYRSRDQFPPPDLREALRLIIGLVSYIN